MIYKMLNNDKVLTQAKALYDLGFGVHWLREKSKVPFKPGWSEPTRDDWAYLLKTYRSGFNLGVRLGGSSQIGNLYLAAIDVDIKSASEIHKNEAYAWLDTRYPGLRKATVHDFSGRGNGSSHYFFLVSAPFASRRVAGASEKVDVIMDKKVVQRAAWEIEFMCIGKQIALPPSIHPDTDKEYFWGIEPKTAFDFAVLPDDKIPEGKSRPGKPIDSSKLKTFQFKDTLIDISILPVSTIKMIKDGEGVEDRSAALFIACKDMARERFSDEEILTVLTDKNNFLGQTGYDHAKTDIRERAAKWVYDYSLAKAKREISGRAAFENEVVVEKLLDEKAALEQHIEIIGETSWENKLEVTKAGFPKPTLLNTLLVLRNAPPKACFRNDLLSGRNYIFGKTPWTEGAQTQINDGIIIWIKEWIADRYRFEPQTNLVYEATQRLCDENAFHPIRDYLRSLDSWDGTNRLDFWLENHFEAKGPKEYLAQVFRKWVVAAIYRVMEPGYKFDWMLIFEGVQGVGKSSFGQILFGEEYFTNRIGHLGDKDAVLNIRAKWCAEFAELKDLSKLDIELIKGFLSTKCDTLRLPYGRNVIDIPRQCVFFGTTNDNTYLKDDTGNRRFNPIEVGQLDFKALKRDREQLLAEALFIYDNGLEKHLELTGEAKSHAITARLEKMVGDDSEVMREQILEFVEAELKKPEAERFDFKKIKIQSLFSPLGPLQNWKHDMRNQKFATKALKLLGGVTSRNKEERFWVLDTKNTF